MPVEALYGGDGVIDDDLTYDELEALARVGSLEQPSDVDPMHFAKLLSLALLEQKEGEPELTKTGRARLDGKLSPRGG